MNTHSNSNEMRCCGIHFAVAMVAGLAVKLLLTAVQCLGSKSSLQ